jgi:excisionase family DNA binding protein
MSEAAQAIGNLGLPLEPLTVTVKEAERLTGLGTTTIYKLIGAKELQTVKIGSRTLIVYSSIKKLLGLSGAA